MRHKHHEDHSSERFLIPKYEDGVWITEIQNLHNGRNLTSATTEIPPTYIV